MKKFSIPLVMIISILAPTIAWSDDGNTLNLTSHWLGITALVIFAMLTMNPKMSHGQWLLVTLPAGVGASLLSIGSAAGVARMGQARGIDTFFAHLKWAPLIALGYAASIVVQLWIYKSLF